MLSCESIHWTKLVFRDFLIHFFSLLLWESLVNEWTCVYVVWVRDKEQEEWNEWGSNQTIMSHGIQLQVLEAVCVVCRVSWERNGLEYCLWHKYTQFDHMSLSCFSCSRKSLKSLSRGCCCFAGRKWNHICRKDGVRYMSVWWWAIEETKTGISQMLTGCWCYEKQRRRGRTSSFPSTPTPYFTPGWQHIHTELVLRSTSGCDLLSHLWYYLPADIPRRVVCWDMWWRKDLTVWCRDCGVLLPTSYCLM